MITEKILIEHYKKVKSQVRLRLKEFSNKKTKKEKFRELCFCILTAGTSAELGIKTLECLNNDVLSSGNKEKIHSCLKGVYRFHNVRADYLANAKSSFDKIDLNSKDVRNNLVKNIKGIGYKEASHFLRNIGFKGYAILDKHVINLLYELNVTPSNKPPKNKKEYWDVEAKMKQFAKRVGVNFDELDLVLWSYKTGKVLK